MSSTQLKLCKDCCYYKPEKAIYGTTSNPRWAECTHPTSLEPAGTPSVVDGSVPRQQRLRCIEARSGYWSLMYPEHQQLCGPDAKYFTRNPT
jgi:hypothetical protein